jgi:hypothetical protein
LVRKQVGYASKEQPLAEESDTLDILLLDIWKDKKRKTKLPNISIEEINLFLVLALSPSL